MLTQPSDHLELDLEAHRRELTGYCYRMLGSGSEAEDAVQETMVRAWRSADALQARAALRAWLYRIATNVCHDMLAGPQRRARPMDLASSSTADTLLGAPMPESTWVLPVADGRVVATEGDPADVAASRETIRLAFVAALQHLPPRQRAVLILRDVLHWRASEVADLLDTTVASVNSALQRARATLDAVDLDVHELDATATLDVDDDARELLDRYVDTFERYDIDSLVTLLHEDATFSMPPFPLWLRGPDQVHAWMLGQGIECKDSRLLPTQASGCPAFGVYHAAGDGVHRPFALAVLEVAGGRITAIHNFLGPGLFPEFGLPDRLEA